MNVEHTQDASVIEVASASVAETDALGRRLGAALSVATWFRSLVRWAPAKRIS